MKSHGSNPAVMAIALVVFATGLAMADKSDVQSLPRRALLQNVCDKCNVPLNQGGCKCDNNCNCLLGANKCDKCNVAVDQGGCKCNSNCDCITTTNPCDKCNLPLNQGGCKCDNNCNCITTSGSGNQAFAGYYQTWSSPWASSAATHQIAHIASYVPIVNLAFMKPDNTYAPGSMSWAGTGVDFSADPSVVKGAIALLKQNNPGTKVLISVGGATYNGWGSLNVNGIAAFVRDFGLDGVDIDFELTPSCSFSGTSVNCNTDGQIIAAINNIRAALPSPYWVTAAVFSVGAYGLGSYANAQPSSNYAGMWINPLKQAGNQMDAIFVMSYDAGPTYDPKVAYAAYKSIYAKKIYMGLETPAESWGGHVLTLSEVDSLTSYFKANEASGMMLWSLQKSSSSDATPTTVAQHVCSGFGMSGCGNPLFS